MARQFPLVNFTYGAPMGRHSNNDLCQLRRSIQLFKVRLDNGGYDDGGAYWGHGQTIYCARDAEGDQKFTRASSRNAAAFQMDILPGALRVPLSGFQAWAYAMIDGRCPWPADCDKAGLFAWIEENKAIFGSK